VTTQDTSMGFVAGSTHTARAVRWAWDTAKSGGLCLAFVLRVTEPDGPQDGKTLPGRLYFDTNQPDKSGRTAADRSMETLRAMGLQDEIDAVDEDAGGLDRGDVQVVVKLNDKGYPEAKYINPPHTGHNLRLFEAPDASAKRDFFAKIKGEVPGAAAKATGTTPAARPAPQQRPAPTPQRGPVQSQAYDPMEGAGGVDDIPF
jgi:hypothetical protein